MKPSVLIETDRVLDEVHSFVLRISINRVHDGKGKPRAQYHLEHVNSGMSSRMKSLEELLDRLEGQIKTVLDDL